MPVLAALLYLRVYTYAVDWLWTPWRYNYVTRAETPDAGQHPRRKGVPDQLAAWPGVDTGCVFCNLIQSVEWAIGHGFSTDQAEAAGFILLRGEALYLCLNAYPYTSGHLMIVPRMHIDSLAGLPVSDAEAMMHEAQHVERALRKVYAPDGINLGMNLGEAAGAGVAGHIHLHALPRWFGDTNFMTVTAETRVLPEALPITWQRLREVLRAPEQEI